MTDQQASLVASKPVGEPQKKQSRAGRNLPAAIGVGVGLGGGVIAILLFAPLVWVGVVAAAMAVATHEVVRRLRTGGFSIPVVPLLIGGQAMVWLTLPFGPAGALGGFGATVVLCLIWRLLSGGLTAAPVNYLRDVSVTVFLAAWIPLFGAFGALLIYPDDGAGRVFCLMLGVVASDVGGYTAGVLFGKHPMVPAISPKKSWEGLAGSLVLGIVVSVLAVTFLLDKPAWVGVPLGIMLVITGTLGDLVESQVKRDLGIKDMGTLLPGHGGLMDRIDSVLPSAVATWIVLTLLA
ncbi:phosphatidate cytidylyltransferase [Mycolicibacterium smegmatis]|uniref:Phosphatidate cytidylyltransferase n=3 Tax=Mycolicibacterium smegmatis TaxID=1772 RepID=I7FBQ8_MYCS2|nr:phosphatidate cytidylyltransferase [Mycolicibacterium smegmatis]ABK72907.1 phosphatidate cytidylyltransferase [Mycolicibacterium smegmatis MC2 155]AFP38950.1 Phosphatidate cytidylyltransferase [Mycolicibacterium smegmatis MC2 155]AIU07722.1 phosphatidate cytidylyltransferase [Mycolicibacterium smegmatis MC2 155]AIU14347.1 phosphatidate cytidylyltransferase [Mycolicibacterium smegmatis]AIU20970.1 phosphatidate cytidylyltransferase [Mycolicibacterium smegmatis]